ncbi:unnamed protein product [Paramecium octaurelia]|uniref:Uncharacterized protein n=1 Tax=Paramecium octaurelia TaxID=43137 RepID=A0A8S1YMW2_PAROT|nr:unnamed protein product [Paramecium octaurelia]
MQNIAQQSNQEKEANQKLQKTNRPTSSRRCKQYKDWQKQKKFLEKQRQMLKKVKEKLEKQNQQLESPKSDENDSFESDEIFQRPCLFYTLMCTGMNGNDFEFLALTDLKLDLIKEAITEQNK